jgi:transglutaminase-like putative cysteine protease
MKKNMWCFFVVCILVLVVVLSGCEVMMPPTTYESSITKISYDLTYGYYANSTGTGKYTIKYGSDIPEVLNGSATYDILYSQDYQQKTLAHNTFIQWNISGESEHAYTLGLTAHVTAESYLVADLNGEQALTIQEIQQRYPTVVTQYTHLQGNETTRYIDPENPNIITIASAVQQQAKTNNSLILAKSLFAWLKEHVQYLTHPNEGGVQPAAVTFSKRTGDCDDLSFLYISLCRACKIPARFIRGYLLTPYENGSVTVVAHAWAEVFVGEPVGNSGWIPVECACITPSIDSDINQNFGVESAFHFRLFTDDGSNESINLSLSSISYMYGLSSKITVNSFADLSNYRTLESKNLVVTTKNIRHYE